MKKILHIIILFFFYTTIDLKAQDKAVTLVVSGQASSSEEAKKLALRSAIEQAFGTFISSETQILNDNLVKDEIITLSSGNVQKFTIINEVKLPDGNIVITLSATISISKLNSYVQSKGYKTEFDGNLFASNMKLKQLNEQNEVKALSLLANQLNSIANASFDFKVEASNPQKKTASDPRKQTDNAWEIVFRVSATANPNILLFKKHLLNTLKSISLSANEVDEYRKLNKEVFPFLIAISENEFEHINFRTREGAETLYLIIQNLAQSMSSFCVKKTIQSITCENTNSEIYVFDKTGGIFLGNKLAMSILTMQDCFSDSYTWDDKVLKEFDKAMKNTDSGDFKQLPKINIVDRMHMSQQLLFSREVPKSTLKMALDLIKSKNFQFIKEAFKSKIVKHELKFGGQSMEVFYPGIAISMISLTDKAQIADFYFTSTKTLDDLSNIKEFIVERK